MPCYVIRNCHQGSGQHNQKQKANNTWSGSEFENAVTLKNDYSGKAGEIFIRDLCKQLKLEHLYDEDKIDENATYDIIINRNKVEIKTARFGESSASFQHESLRSDGCDLYAFVDILPDTIYLSVFSSNFDYSKKHPIFKRTPHLRKGTSDVYKFDPC